MQKHLTILKTEMNSHNLKKLLLINTGGTIASRKGNHGLAPSKGVVEAAVKSAMSKDIELITHSFDPLIDSSDVSAQIWNEILDIIDAHENMPVLITHGTDTLPYTSTALAQATYGLGRRIVLCASMKPLGFGGDAEFALQNAVEFACAHNTEAAKVAVGAHILNAHAIVKHNSQAKEAFREVAQSSLNQPQKRRFEPKRLAIITMSPDMPASALNAMLGELDGAVLRVYGAGTFPNHANLIAILRNFITSGKKMVMVSQCEEGGTHLDQYAASQELKNIGIIDGQNFTAESALIWLWLNT